ncbi:CynX/NimT family MFS transporter [Pseudonocardia sp.]|uniref:MFS transporter n=1 Tax=Pseudonocardia sp. TaxID=60912 RepID=UPI003D146B3D
MTPTPQRRGVGRGGSGRTLPDDPVAGPAARTVRPAVVLLGVLALAANLRAALAGYPPLLETVRADLGLSAAVAGLVQAGAVLMMAVGSFAGSSVDARFGREAALGGAVALVGVGSLVRGVPVAATLIGGSLVIGFGIGVAGVLLTGVVKEHLAARAGAATGGYVVAMMVGATLSSALAVPLAVLLGGWSWSLAVWSVPAVLAAALWAPIAARTHRHAAATAATPPAGSVERAPRRVRRLPWNDRLARLTACYQAGTSTMFYGWLTWLAPYYDSLGWSAERAGLLLAVWSVGQIPAALLVPALAERRRRWRFWASLMLASAAVGTLGALVVPLPPIIGPWIWALLISFGLGAGFPLGLAVIAWRTPHGAASAATSGFALGIGYTAAGVAPVVMGVLVDVSGYPAAIAVLLLAAAVQAVAIWRIGDRPA